ncbi:hypothetical protein [Parageobacillus thermoglucosidasius]|uniref:Uncharacterized protein n=1 Tax=Parageobacillus thermoglucosidasius TaxID=1426 RepID=A0AB38QV23_PARTM|nr:hypothetical protein [Parageobacillus thermoglucosidasius]UOE75283.1 hypothetical protein IMI45_13245 [Parageobacillus thermoglucosidasius]
MFRCQNSVNVPIIDVIFPPRTFARRLRQSGCLRHPSREDSGFSNAACRPMDDGPIVCVLDRRCLGRIMMSGKRMDAAALFAVERFLVISWHWRGERKGRH